MNHDLKELFESFRKLFYFMKAFQICLNFSEQSVKAISEKISNKYNMTPKQCSEAFKKVS